MMIVMKPPATDEQVDAVIRRIEEAGARAHPSRGELVTVIGAIGDREHVARLGLEGAPGVDKLVPILKPYKLASSQLSQGQQSVLEIAERKVGGEHFALIAGPCTVESRDQVLSTADVVHAAGATMFRGGAYKPRTSPYAFQGLGAEGLRLLAEAKERTGLPVVTELIKRGLSSTLEELLMAAEYVLKEGNENVLLCERGIRTFETAYRFTLDLTAIPVLKDLSHLPVIVTRSRR